jgi:predicted DNA-binding protein
MARSSLFGEPASESIRVRVTPDQKTALKQVAKDNHTKMANVIREAVDEYIADCQESRCFVVRK